MMRGRRKGDERFRRPARRLTADRALGRLADGFLLLSFAYVAWVLLQDAAAGAHNWRQGDWLIHNEAGAVRRGLFGSALLRLSDMLGRDPVSVVIGLQLALLASAYLAFRALLGRLPGGALRVLLAVSPAIFPVFWVADPDGALRKEVLAFAGLSMVALGGSGRRRGPVIAGSAFFAVGLVAHEGLVLFIPTYLGLLYLTSAHRSLPGSAVVCAALVLCTGLFAAVYAVGTTGAADTGAMCRALTQRAVDGRMCEGAIGYLGLDAAERAAHYRGIVASAEMGRFVVSYAAALACFAYMATLTSSPVRTLVALALLALPFLPLYLVAVDWGRWISFHVFTAAVFGVSAVAAGRLRLQRTPSLAATAALVALGLLLSPAHFLRDGHYSALASLVAWIGAPL